MAATSQNKEKFEDYEGFVAKFQRPRKKTTDDCYTPAHVYETVLKWVDERIMPLDGVKVLRPFYPEGDYENADYPPGSVVIDNPPFSILSKICRFYSQRGIKYFLFAPTTSLLRAPVNPDETFIVTSHRIIYDNGASINTSFRTNMLGGEPLIMVAGDLTARIKEACGKQPIARRQIKLPDNIISAARLTPLCERGINLEFSRSDCHYIRDLTDSGYRIFGGGYLLSERATAAKVAVENSIIEHVTLSDREKEIIRNLGKNN